MLNINLTIVDISKEEFRIKILTLMLQKKNQHLQHDVAYPISKKIIFSTTPLINKKVRQDIPQIAISYFTRSATKCRKKFCEKCCNLARKNATKNKNVEEYY